MKPEIRAVWDKMRTASLRGNIGRHVGWDLTIERMNLEVANMLGHNISGERIQEVIRQLNGIRYVQGAAFSAFGIGEDGDLSEYNGILDSDVKQLVQHLKVSFGFNGVNDAAKLFASMETSSPCRVPNSLGPASQTSKPWNRYATTLIAPCDLLREIICSDEKVTKK
jgi:hypothetical protein